MGRRRKKMKDFKSESKSKSMSKDRWKIRFGQIFQAQLEASGKKLEDHLYFFPGDEGSEPDPTKEESYDLVDLNVNRNLYSKYFSKDIPPIPVLNKHTAARLGAALVIVPGFGHHLISQKTFEIQIPILQELGFKVIYAKYADSFESNESCAERVYHIVKDQLEDGEKAIFFTYSKGGPILVDLLSNPNYSDVIDRTKAVVSFAGALRGSLLASSSSTRATLRLLKAFKRFSRPGGFLTKLYKLIYKLVIKCLSLFPAKTLKEWNQLVKKADEFKDDLCDLLVGITELTRLNCTNEHSDRQLPRTVKLFSLSSVYPRAAFRKGFSFISNPEDLFLYVSGGELYKHNVFNDAQVLLPDSKFFDGMGDITDLGAVKADHWGIALARVFSKKYKDPFPRTCLVKAVILLLDEYFNQS
jgi:hypothetical protein